jgi:hypothetical protein
MKHDEKQMRETKVPTPKTPEELTAYITSLVEGDHDYGTCVYAMSMAANAAFNYVASNLGVTGFQASCADMDILRRTRSMEVFSINNMESLLYPQYCNEEHFPTYRQLIAKHKDWLKAKAVKLLEERQNAASEVIEHWEMLAK